MKLNDLIKEYHRKLIHLYPPQEIHSIIRLVLETYFKISPVNLSGKKNTELHFGEQSVMQNILDELETGKPVQYIIGETGFYDLKIKVNKDVLIPRQETEELVDWIVNEHQGEKKKLKILDIGTGSGCIAIALAKNLEKSEISAIDISSKVLETATKNAIFNEVTIDFFSMNILKHRLLPEQFDIIVSNPPYVTNREKELMHKNVVDFEPVLALFVPDKEPLLFYDAIVDFSKKHLNNHGKLFVEINEQFGKETVRLFKKNGFTSVQLKKDLNGKDRFVKGVYIHE